MLTRYRLYVSEKLVDIYGIPTDAEHWTPTERAQLAREMIAQWQAFAQVGQQPVDLGAELSARLAR